MSPNNITIVVLLSVIILFIISFFSVPYSLPLQGNVEKKIPALLTYLLLAAFIVDRVLEFFLSLWRGGETMRMDLEINQLERKINKETNSVNLSSMLEEFDHLEKKRIYYRAYNRKIALGLGFLIGLLVSFFGIRILGSLVVIPEAGIKMRFFMVFDIITTAFALAGGSDAINQLIKSFRSSLSIR